MRTAPLLSLLAVLHGCLFVNAISQRDAGSHDWHLSLIGKPSVEAGKRPRFHYAAGRKQSHVSALVYTATQRNVLAAIDPRAGGLVWRQVFPTEQPILRFALQGDSILALTGPAASQVHLFSASTGHLAWSVNQHSPERGLLPEPGSIAADAVFASTSQDSDVFTLANGRDVRLISGKTGDVVWEYTIDLPTEPLAQIHAILPPSQDATLLQLLLIKRNPGSYGLLTININTIDGTAYNPSPRPIQGVSVDNLESLLILPPAFGTAESRIITLDKAGQLHSVFLFVDGSSPPIISKYSGDAVTKFIELVSVDLEEEGIFVAKRKDGTAVVFVCASDGIIKQLYAYGDSQQHALYSGILDRAGNSHVTRFHISQVLGMASMSTWTRDATEHSAAGVVFGSTFPYVPSKYGDLVTATAEVAPRTGPSLIARMIVTSTSGAFQGWLGGGLQFSREEGLAHLSYSAKGIDSIAFLPLSRRNGSISSDIRTLSIPTSPSQAVDILKYSLDIALRTIGLRNPVNAVSTSHSRDWLSDAFGYRKIAYVASELGKLYAVDVGNGGTILWERILLPLSNDPKTGYQSCTWRRLFVSNDRQDGRVLLTAFAVVKDAHDGSHTYAYYMDGLTGEAFSKTVSQEEISRSSIDEVYTVGESTQSTFAIADFAQKTIRLHRPPQPMSPSEPGTSDIRDWSLTALTVPNTLTGFTAASAAYDKDLPLQGVWQYSQSHGRRIVASERQTRGKVASVGRVLGDRSTLHKYLNPHLYALVLIDDSAETLTVLLVDGLTGTLQWSTTYEGVAPAGTTVHVTLTENWLVYAFSDQSSEGHRTRITSVELFKPTTCTSESPRFGRDTNETMPYAISQAFILPVRITSLSTSQTVHGISTKTLLVSTSQDQIIAIPRRFLDPRRPTQKPTKADMEEMLMPYDPLITIDPKWVITHKVRVAGVRGIASTPTILESTSQVLAYGLDLFGSSVSPSGRFDVLSRDFNKVQLLATTLALLAAIGVMRPIVQRKSLKERWYPAT